MASVSSTFHPRAGNQGLLPLKEESHYQRLFEEQAARSYLYLSLGIGVIAILLPIVLMLVGGYDKHDSMSSYYTSDVHSSRDILVGSLCAVGVFLFLFHGLSKVENWLLNFAGAAVIAVALIPMTVSTCLHRGFAVIFFLLIGIVAIFLSKGRIEHISHTRTRRLFKTAYTAVGIAMIVVPSIAAAQQFFGNPNWMFLTEFAGIGFFSIYWFLKTWEYHLLLRIRWFAP
jgi:hypothetical protein